MNPKEIVEGNAYTDDVEPSVLVALVHQGRVTFVPRDGRGVRTLQEDLDKFAARMKRLVPVQQHEILSFWRQQGR